MAEQDFKKGMDEYAFCCVGRFVWGKPLTVKAYRTVMCQVWGCLDLNIVKFNDQVYQLFFPDEGTRKKALERVPWCFDDYLFIIESWHPAMESPNFRFRIPLDSLSVLFHIAHLPRDYHTMDVGYKISSFLTHC